MSMLTIYHGSNKKIERPEYKKGKKTNDYGVGFYCTQHYELACEWAAKSRDVQGWVNKYSIDTKELKILDLTEKKYSLLTLQKKRVCYYSKIHHTDLYKE